MADISALSTANIAVVFPLEAETITMVAAEAITRGQPVFQDSAGKAELADANAAGEQQFRGIALDTVGAGSPVSILKKGHLAGFDLSGMAFDDIAYLSDTVGAIADAAGTLTVHVGRVVALPDLTKVLYVEADWLRTWA